MAAVNSVGSSALSSAIAITTTAVCTITRSTFVQPAISYTLGTAAVSFQIPVYTLTGCPVGETLVDSSSYNLNVAGI